MKNTNKKGFTIVELVVVVAVIAILAAVLIPTFSGVIKNANLSADQAAVRNINTILAAATDKLETTDDVEELLAANGYNVKGYTPLSSNHSFVWDKEENQVLLYSYTENKVVFPEGYKGKGWEVLTSTAANYVKVDTADKVIEAVANGGVINITEDIALTGTTPALTITKDTTVELGNATITVPNDTDGSGVFHVTDGVLVLNGNGTVNGAGDNDYNYAIWADGGDVVINGGYYTNVKDNPEPQEELIYVKNGSKITINGGSFKCATPAWTLNSNNVHARPGSIVIKGGEFFEFNPNSTDPMPDDRTLVEEGITVADGYTVISETRADGIWYIVVPETN